MDSQTITLRSATPADTLRIRAVAALDSAREPGHDALLGELDGEVVAVITMRDGVVAADPFRRTSEVVDLLQTRRVQLLRSAAAPSTSRRRWRARSRRFAPESPLCEPVS